MSFAVPFAGAVGAELAKEHSVTMLGLKASGVIASARVPIGLTAALSKHNSTFKKEKNALFYALNKERNNIELQKFLSDYNYLVIDRSGNIVGKKFNPKMGFVPIGRRKVLNPFKKRIVKPIQKLNH